MRIANSIALSLRQKPRVRSAASRRWRLFAPQLNTAQTTRLITMGKISKSLKQAFRLDDISLAIPPDRVGNTNGACRLHR